MRRLLVLAATSMLPLSGCTIISASGGGWMPNPGLKLVYEPQHCLQLPDDRRRHLTAFAFQGAGLGAIARLAKRGSGHDGLPLPLSGQRSVRSALDSVPPPTCDQGVLNTPGRIVGLLALVAIIAAPLVPEISPIVLIVLVAVFVGGRPFADVSRAAASVIPAAVYVAWGALPQPPVADIAWCGDLLAPPVLRTVGGALAGFAVTSVLGWRLRMSGQELGLIRPSPRLVAVSLVAALAVALGGLALGTTVATPFFGTVELKLDEPGAVVPALLVASASGSMQEVAYRGAMLGWLTSVLGARAALLAQAVAFGAAHIGPDFITSPLPVMIAVAGGGLVAGLIVQRYRSLTFPAVVHAGFDIPLYFVAACRLA